jgi:hypothetical protein
MRSAQRYGGPDQGGASSPSGTLPTLMVRALHASQRVTITPCVRLPPVLRKALRRFGRSLGTVGLAVVILALLVPLALGAAVEPLAREFGGTPAHTCACGMRPGTCGCPECERLLHDGSTSKPSLVAVLSSCDDHGRSALASAIPPCMVPPALVVALSPSLGLLPASLDMTGAPSEPGAPPTPPPRIDTV